MTLKPFCQTVEQTGLQKQNFHKCNLVVFVDVSAADPHMVFAQISLLYSSYLGILYWNKKLGECTRFSVRRLIK